MLWISLAAMLTSHLATPPLPDAGQHSERARPMAIAIAGLDAEVAAAAGLTEQQAADIISAIVSRGTDQLLQQLDPTSSRTGQRSSFESLAHDTTTRAFTQAGVDRATTLRFENCSRAARAGLPAALGLACENEQSLTRLTRAFRAERRATRAGRPLAAVHAEALRTARALPAVQDANQRAATSTAAMRQVLEGR